MIEQLLQLLHERANHRGRVVARAVWLEESLACSFQELEAALNDLSSDGEVEILSPLPWLIAKVRKGGAAVASSAPSWSGSSPTHVHSEQQTSSDSARAHKEVPVSSSAAAAAMQQREDGGAGEGEVLLEEVLAALGPDADRDEFRSILAGQSPALIHRCLKRVQATRSIRVSRAALFRSLLAKLS